ncbi:hypothetical protein LB505_004430 [Fusarium chuoi]|nr:hypothetical protein LB505_004430 [Fusarium chuoi]
MNLATTDRFSHRREKLRVFLPRPVQHVMPKIQRISCDESASARRDTMADTYPRDRFPNQPL